MFRSSLYLLLIAKKRLVKTMTGSALEVQLLRLRLPVQGVRVQSLVGNEDLTCLVAIKIQNIKQKQCCNKFNLCTYSL